MPFTYDPKISLGNILTVGGMLFMIAVAWAQMSESANRNRQMIIGLEAQQARILLETRETHKDMETRVRWLETNYARNDERLVSIAETLGRIEARLDGVLEDHREVMGTARTQTFRQNP